jgi:transposase
MIAGNLSGVRYRDEILHPIVKPYAGAVGDGFILMDDNARPHRARVVTDYLENETIERMEWPSSSPEMNPIEHAWDMLQKAVLSNTPEKQNEKQHLVRVERSQIVR